MFTGPFDFSIVKRAQEAGYVELSFINLRDFGLGKHQTVDDKTYGGGKGMLLRVDVLEKAVEKTLNKNLSKDEQKVVFLGPKGETYNQKKAVVLSKLKHLILICGHYEGIDQRAYNFIDEEISIGDFITTGGEIPAMLLVDSISRLISGVLPEGVTDEESFSGNLLEYPQYTRPEVHKKSKVPSTLLSGHHEKIKQWKEKKSREVTQKTRPDLITGE